MATFAHKLRIGVLMGGRSQEKEVSLNSGRSFCDHLDTERYEVFPLFQTYNGDLYKMPWHFLHRGKISDFEHRLAFEAEKLDWDGLKGYVDFIYIAQHGRYAEDGRLQGMLEVLQIPYFGSKVLASALGMDKGMQRHFLKAAHIDVPQACIIDPDTKVEELLEKVKIFSNKYPLIVKPAHEGSSLGIQVVSSQEFLERAVEKAASTTPGIKQPVVIEELIEGMEFTCIIITDYLTGTLQALPPSEVTLNSNTSYFDYEQKYMPGKAMKHTPARCTAEQTLLIQETCIKVMKTLGFTNIARVDGFLTPDNRVVIIDPNSLCGMDPSTFIFLQAAEVNTSTTQIINHLIETELHFYNLLPSVQHNNKTYNNSMNTAENTTDQTCSKLRVAVLLGGKSHEKEISLASGRNVVYKLSPHKYQAIPIFVSSTLELYEIDQRLLVRNTTAEIEEAVTPAMKLTWSDLKRRADFVFIGLHGGEGENGCVQGALETIGIPYNGSSVLASALCMDKYKTAQFLHEQGFDVPVSKLISKSTFQKWYEEWCIAQTPSLPIDLQYPIVIKPHDDGCSVGVFKANSDQELMDHLKKLFALGKEYAMLEQYIKGIELTVGVVGNRNPFALPPSMAVAQSDILSIEEKFLPGAGENQTPAPLDPQALELVKNTMQQAYKALGCKGYVRIDCFYQPASLDSNERDKVIILEVNTLPGLTPATCIFHQAAEIGLKPMDFIDLIVQLGLEEQKTSGLIEADFKTIIKKAPALNSVLSI